MTVAVDPLRVTLLDQVEEEVERKLAHADERAAYKVREAEQRGRALVERARSEGTTAAGIAGADEVTRAHRRARATVLVAKRELYDELVRQARAAAFALRRDPHYSSLLERLSAAARAQLGEDAVLELDPPAAGGVRASSGERYVDYTLDPLVERCLERLGSEVEQLWL